MALKFALLAILSREEMTGYDLSKDVERSTGFFWHATHQQIYKELAALQDEGWVEHTTVDQSEKPSKKVYAITKPGLAALQSWGKEPSDMPKGKDAFLIKLFAGDVVGSDVLLDDIRRQKKIHAERRQSFKEIEARFFSDVASLSTWERMQYLTLRRGIGYETAWLAWCKEVEESLEGEPFPGYGD